MKEINQTDTRTNVTRKNMADKDRFNKIFEEMLNDTATTESVQHVRLCIDQNDNISLANLVSKWSDLTEKFVQVCLLIQRRLLT